MFPSRFAPLSIRATSSMRSAGSSLRIGGLRPPLLSRLFHQEVLVGKRCNLRQMRHAEHLLRPAQVAFSFCPTASAARPPMPISISSKTSVRGSSVLRFPFPARAAPSSTLTFSASRHAAHLAARGDLIQRLQRLAGIGRNPALRLRPIRAPSSAASSFCGVDLHGKARLHRQIVDLPLRQLCQLLRRGGACRRQRSASPRYPAAACASCFRSSASSASRFSISFSLPRPPARRRSPR